MKKSAKIWRAVAFLLLFILIFSQFFSIKIEPKFEFLNVAQKDSQIETSGLQNKVVPSESYQLPVSWGELGPILLDSGVIDLAKFEEIGSLTEEQKQVLTKGSNEPITITQENNRFIVNMLWALGLAQKSKVYEDGPMGKDYQGQLGNFASTGGWTLGKLAATSYLGNYQIVDLSEEEQEKVSEIAQNVYRPCCGNNTWFPDCNHGMAALGAIELMVKEGISDEEIYKNLLALNSYWFPTAYTELAVYFQEQGESWDEVDAKLVLGKDYSSAQGYQTTRKKIKSLPQPAQNGGSCGV